MLERNRMKDIDIEVLKTTASKFRKAIEACDKKVLPLWMRDFPRGACGNTSLLLAKYLQHSGFGLFNYVCGNRGEQGHAWLQKGKLIVDITADQFEEIQESVLVTIDRHWHKQFKVHIKHKADFEMYD